MKSIVRCFVLSLMVALLAGRLGAVDPEPAKVRILSLEPTALFPRREPLCQIARLSVVNTSGASIRCDAVVTLGGGDPTTVPGLELASDQTKVDILVPDIASESTVKVELRRDGAVLASHQQAWQPQRKWKVYIVKSSHEDIGYENYIFKKQHDIANFIELGRELSSPKSVAGNIGTTAKMESSYHYTLETLLFQRNYIEERGERAWREIVEKDLKTGNMALMGAPSGVHSHWMDYEELARMTYPARREAKDRFGLDIKTFMIIDNPSLSWSGAQALAGAGFKYVARWGQSWRSGGNNSYETTHVPAIFWWVGPDGVSKVLYSWRSHYAMGFWFGQTGSYPVLGSLAAGHVSEVLKEVESGSTLGPYPYDALITPEYVDHDTPRFDMRVLPSWRDQYAFPEIRVAGPDEFFTYVETKYGASLPVLHGDLNNFSADYASIDPASQGWKREAARLLPAAEGLGVLAAMNDPAFAVLPAEVERLYMRMFDYDEHCWPTLPRATDEQLFNAAWVKNHEARRVLDGTQNFFKRAAAALAKNIADQGAGTLAVFNPLVHARTDLVEVMGSASAVTDLRTGKSIPCEPDGEGRFAFLAENIPAFGYALFRMETGVTGTGSAAGLTADHHSISNQYYLVRFDAENGSVTSILDKSNNRELVDAKAPYRANQLVYVHKKTRESKEGFEYSPVKAVRMSPRVGKTSVAFDVWIDDPKLGGRIHQTVTLHAGVKRVDITNRLESIDVMAAKTYEDRYCDNIYYAFPFAVPNGQIRVEYPGGVVRPYDDQLRWGSHDYLYANRWVDVSNAEGGVTLASHQAGTFSLGEIRYNQFAVDYKPSKPWLFSYAWSNRMGGLLTLEPDDCNATFTYSLTNHDGDWNSGATTKHGWQTASPLLVLPVSAATEKNASRWNQKEKSFLSVDASNVQLTVLKSSGQAGRGWIARLVETEGRATDFELDASALGIEQAALCDLVENDTAPLSPRAGKIRVSIRPFGFTTVRLWSGGEPAAVGAVQASEVTDSALRLHWPKSAGDNIGYNIFRSDDPDAPATGYSLIARTRGTDFTDSGLNLATHYYYRVAAATASNLQGPLSKPLNVQTSSKNTSPPSLVQELGVVRRSADTLILYWRRNHEPDVARYRVFRGESADFPIEGRDPLTVLEANSYFLQIYRDTGLEAGKTYYYRVQAVDWSDNHQPSSPVASATTPKGGL